MPVLCAQQVGSYTNKFSFMLSVIDVFVQAPTYAPFPSALHAPSSLQCSEDTY